MLVSQPPNRRCHQRRRFPGRGVGASRSAGGSFDSIQPGKGGFSLKPQETPRLLGSNIFTKCGASIVSVNTTPQ